MRVYKTYPNLGVGEKKETGEGGAARRHNASLWRSKRASWRGARRERVENSSLDALARSTRRLTPSRRLEGAIRFDEREPARRASTMMRTPSDARSSLGTCRETNSEWLRFCIAWRARLGGETKPRARQRRFVRRTRTA